jgi:hypothetical protein
MTAVVLQIICPYTDNSKFHICKFPIFIFRRQYNNIGNLNSYKPEEIVANLLKFE